MKAILRFDLSDEDDKYKYEACSNAMKYKSWLYDFSQIIRAKLKHGGLPPDEDKVWEEVREAFYNCNDSGVELD